MGRRPLGQRPPSFSLLTQRQGQLLEALRLAPGRFLTDLELARSLYGSTPPSVSVPRACSVGSSLLRRRPGLLARLPEGWAYLGR